MKDSRNSPGELTAIGDLFATKALQRQIKAAAGPTIIRRRLLDAAAAQDDDQSILFQHAVFCQTCLPYRDPGDEVRTWERSNGLAHLLVKAGDGWDAENDRFYPLGLPFGPKPRLALMFVNQRAVLTQSPDIEVGDTFTQFVQKVMKLDPNGRNMRTVNDQLRRLAEAEIKVGHPDGTLNTTKLCRVSNLWLTKDPRQRRLWEPILRLTLDYFVDLMQHAVPLDERHITALSHSSMALDIYTWLAHRLHRVSVGKPVPVSWGALHQQFGQGYDPERIDNFRRVFRVALKEVLTLYKSARVRDEEPRPPRLQAHNGSLLWREKPAKGLMLYNSPPPVLKLLRPSEV